MFSLCKQSVPATGVEFAIKCRFFNNLEKSLVVGGANVIRVYRIIPDVPINSQEKFTGKTVSLIIYRLITQFSFVRYSASKNEIGMFGDL